MGKCKTCELIARRDAGAAPLWDCIYRTDYWDVAHCSETSLPGWLVLVLRRHIESIDELTQVEAAELGALIRQTSMAIKQITSCSKTYILQFAENLNHPHVHFHVIPRMADLPEDRKGPLIFGYLGVPPEQRTNEHLMNAIAVQVRDELESMSTGLTAG